MSETQQPQNQNQPIENQDIKIDLNVKGQNQQQPQSSNQDIQQQQGQISNRIQTNQNPQYQQQPQYNSQIQNSQQQPIAFQQPMINQSQQQQTQLMNNGQFQQQQPQAGYNYPNQSQQQFQQYPQPYQQQPQQFQQQPQQQFQQPQQQFQQPQQQFQQPQQQFQQIPIQQQPINGQQMQGQPMPNTNQGDLPVYQQQFQQQPGFVPQLEQMQYKDEDKQQDLLQLKNPSCSNYQTLDKRDFFGGLIGFVILILGIIQLASNTDNYVILILFYIGYTIEYILCPMRKYISEDLKTIKDVEAQIQQWKKQVPNLSLNLNAWNTVRRGKSTRREYKLKDCRQVFNFRSCQDHTGGLYPELFERTWLVRTKIQVQHTMGTPQAQTAWDNFYNFWDNHAKSLAKNHETKIKCEIPGADNRNYLVMGEKGQGISTVSTLFYITSILGFSFIYRMYFFSNISYYECKIRKTIFL